MLETFLGLKCSKAERKLSFSLTNPNLTIYLEVSNSASSASMRAAVGTYVSSYHQIYLLLKCEQKKRKHP